MNEFEKKHGFDRDNRIIDVMQGAEHAWVAMWGDRRYDFTPWPQMCTATCLLLAPMLRASVPHTNFDIEVGQYLDGIQLKHHAWIRYGDPGQTPIHDWICDPTHEQFEFAAMITDTGDGKYKPTRRLSHTEENGYRTGMWATFSPVVGFNTPTKIAEDFFGKIRTGNA